MSTLKHALPGHSHMARSAQTDSTAPLRHSRQRESIRQFLATTKEHPTADRVYQHMKEEFPNISLGTVYRNLNLLTDIGEVRKITPPDSADRFDGNTTPHNHFYCTKCKCILDLNLDMQEFEPLHHAASVNFDGVIESSNTFFFGLCGNCVKRAHELV